MTTGRSVLSLWPEILTCEKLAGCRLSWAAPDLATEANHQRGLVDPTGRIHYSGLDARIRAPGIFQLLRLVALATHREWRTVSPWYAMYLTSVWASKELKSRFHRMAFVRWTAEDRQYSWMLANLYSAHLGLSKTERLNYLSWVAGGLDEMSRRGKRMYLRKPVTNEETAEWRALRKEGVTYKEISRRYKRATKVIWYHLR